ncbi:MAG: FHA domain-containing protein [Deltaproteobacteria bacterium]|nr:FHA domain-containing protein [Deltaproteobacteria bacterium]
MAELIVSLKGRELQRYPVAQHVIHVGRAPTNDLVLANESVSREHATVSFTARGFALQPLSDTNPVWLNGAPCPRAAPLSDGDAVQLGKYVLTLSLQGGPPLSALLADDFETSAETEMLAPEDLRRYSEALRLDAARPLAQRRLDDLRAAERRARLLAVALALSAALNVTLALWLRSAGLL